jgi:hypothetical protein
VNYTTVAKKIRDKFKICILNEGAVPWQRGIVKETGRNSEEED